ncbi:MAG TPA: PH domain-containing protein [Candidatus Paceibacterota bacterium]
MKLLRFEHLGLKSLIIFILSMTPPMILILVLWGAIAAFQNQFPEEVQPYIVFVYSLLFLSFIFLGILACLVGYLKYITYKFALDEDALRIERGIINREIIAVPYRQIQNINIDRNLFNRLFSLSNLVITTAAHEEKDEEGDNAFESEGILPLLDKYRAEEIHAELLKRTNVEKVIAMNQTIK